VQALEGDLVGVAQRLGAQGAQLLTLPTLPTHAQNLSQVKKNASVGEKSLDTTTPIW
jgi:hypothetical protein